MGDGDGGIIVTNVYDVVIRSTPICMTNNSDISPSVIPINHSLVKYFLRCSDEMFLEKLRFEITVASCLLIRDDIWEPDKVSHLRRRSLNLKILAAQLCIGFDMAVGSVLVLE